MQIINECQPPHQWGLVWTTWVAVDREDVPSGITWDLIPASQDGTVETSYGSKGGFTYAWARDSAAQRADEFAARIGPGASAQEALVSRDPTSIRIGIESVAKRYRCAGENERNAIIVGLVNWFQRGRPLETFVLDTFCQLKYGRSRDEVIAWLGIPPTWGEMLLDWHPKVAHERNRALKEGKAGI